MSENIRLLQCATCKTVEVLPDYRGPVEYDDTLRFVVEKHKFPDGSEHFGNLMPATVDGLDGQMRPATFDDWNNEKFQKIITEQLNRDLHRPGHGAGLGEKFYDAKNNFAHDANRCFSLHLRPKGRCPDYKDDKKRLLPDTAKERKAEGLDKPRSNRFLCEFCPVQAFMEMKNNQSKLG